MADETFKPGWLYKWGKLTNGCRPDYQVKLGISALADTLNNKTPQAIHRR